MNDIVEKKAHLQMIVVDSFKHGAGIGKALCEFIHLMAKENGMKKCILTVDKGNNKAERLYNSLGYVDSCIKHNNNNKKNMEIILIEDENENC